MRFGDMNDIKILLLNLKKNKIFSFIKIFGLAKGLTCSIMIIACLYHEPVYITYSDHAKRIYRAAVRFYS